MSRKNKVTIGWREWVALPELGCNNIKAKIDTGARTSSLHAFDMKTFTRRGIEYVSFKIHPEQKSSKKVIEAVAAILEYRDVKSSSGQTSERPVILTQIELMDEIWDIELTLANRDEMGFRMLVGREGIRGRMVVDPGSSYYNGVPKKRVRRLKKRTKR